MSVALRSDPITFGDLQDALNDACTESESRTIQREEEFGRVIDMLRDDIAELLGVIKSLEHVVVDLAGRVTSAAA